MTNIIYLSFLLIISGISKTLLACTCDIPETKDAFDAYNYVFIGTVTQGTAVPSPDGEYRYANAEITVEKLYKGNISSPVSVSSGLGAGDCSIRFIIGERYIVFMEKDGKFLHYCNGTGRLDHLKYIELEKTANQLKGDKGH